VHRALKVRPSLLKKSTSGLLADALEEKKTRVVGLASLSGVTAPGAMDGFG
jgi:hypothetical protein